MEFLHVALLVPRILRWLLCFGEIYVPLHLPNTGERGVPLSRAKSVLHCAGTENVSCLEHCRWHTRTLPRRHSPHHLRTLSVVLYVDAP